MWRLTSWITFILIAIQKNVIAQPGIAEMQQATQDLKKTFFSATDASFILAGIFGLFGALRIYHNWQLGKHHFHVDYEVAAWFFASLFIVLLGAFLKALYGL